MLDIFCACIKFYVPLSPYLCLIFLFYLDFYVLGDNSWMSKNSFIQKNQTSVCLDTHQN